MPPRSASLTLRRPPSHWAFPFLMIGASWLPVLALTYLPVILSSGPVSVYVQTGLHWILARVTLGEIQMVCAGLSALSAFFFVLGMTRVRLSESGIQWEIVPYIWRRWRWTSLREIRIDETGRHFEDDEFSKRTIVIRGPGPLGLGRDTLRLTNRVWDHFDEAEMATIAVGIPAIASRIARRLQSGGRPERFSLDGNTSILTSLIYLALAVGATLAALRDDLWVGALEPWRPVPMALAVALLLMSLTGLLALSLGLDRRYLYVLRRGWVSRRIPIESIAEVETRDNSTRIRVWRDGTRSKSKEVWRTDRFIRNRGVLLHLLREFLISDHREDPPEAEEAVRPPKSGPRTPAAIPPPVPAPRRVLSATPKVPEAQSVAPQPATPAPQPPPQPPVAPALVPPTSLEPKPSEPGASNPIHPDYDGPQAQESDLPTAQWPRSNHPES